MIQEFARRRLHFFLTELWGKKLSENNRFLKTCPVNLHFDFDMKRVYLVDYLLIFMRESESCCFVTHNQDSKVHVTCTVDPQSPTALSYVICTMDLLGRKGEGGWPEPKTAQIPAFLDSRNGLLKCDSLNGAFFKCVLLKLD